MIHRPIPWDAAAPVELWHGSDADHAEAARLWWRAECERRAERLRHFDAADERARESERELCRRSKRHWIEQWGWMHAPGAEPTYRTCPVVLWPRQVEYLEWTTERIAAGQRCLVPKTRELGITWINLWCHVLHPWIFDAGGYAALLGAHRGDAVDRLGDIGSLFGKLRWMLDHLPRWLRPEHTSPEMLLRNAETGGEIRGELTTADFGKGRRTSLLFVDELSSVLRRIASQMMVSTESVAGAQLWVWNPARPDHVAHRLHHGDDRHDPAPAEMVFFLDWTTDPRRPPDFIERRTEAVGQDVTEIAHLGRYGVVRSGRVLDVAVNPLLYGEEDLSRLSSPRPLREVATILCAWDFASGGASYLCAVWGMVDWWSHPGVITLRVDSEHVWLQTAARDAGETWKTTQSQYGGLELWVSGDPAGRHRESDQQSWEDRLVHAGVPLSCFAADDPAAVNSLEWKQSMIRRFIELAEAGRIKVHRRCTYVRSCIERWTWRGVRDGDELGWLDRDRWTPAKDKWSHGGECLLYLLEMMGRIEAEQGRPAEIPGFETGSAAVADLAGAWS